MSIFITLILVLALIFILLAYEGQKTISLNTIPQRVNYEFGGLKGQTPAKVRLKPGKYQLRLFEYGWESKTIQVEVKPFQKETSLSYTLNALVGKGSSISKDDVDKQLANYKKAFPYASLLPFQGKDFYIDMPYNSGIINIYIFQNNESQAKQDAYNWFHDHGEPNPQNLNIDWKYSD